MCLYQTLNRRSSEYECVENVPVVQEEGFCKQLQFVSGIVSTGENQINLHVRIQETIDVLHKITLSNFMR